MVLPIDFYQGMGLKKVQVLSWAPLKAFVSSFFNLTYREMLFQINLNPRFGCHSLEQFSVFAEE